MDFPQKGQHCLSLHPLPRVQGTGPSFLLHCPKASPTFPHRTATEAFLPALPHPAPRTLADAPSTPLGPRTPATLSFLLSFLPFTQAAASPPSRLSMHLWTARPPGCQSRSLPVSPSPCYPCSQGAPQGQGCFHLYRVLSAR